MAGGSAEPEWVDWARRLRAIGQTGLAYPQDPYNAERYRQLLEIAAEMMAAGSGRTVESVLDLFAPQAGHATPKVDVRAAVFRADGVLLVRERSDGRWSLPGGWADVGESAAESAAREVWEESGYLVRPVRLLALLDRAKHPHPPLADHAYKAIFGCELSGGAAGREDAPPHAHEIAEVGFFGERELPDLSTGRVTPGQLARLFEQHRHPEWPADFD